MVVPAIEKESRSVMSASLHGADDLDPVAVTQSGRRPGGARHDRAIERDGEALGRGQFKLGGLRTPQIGEIRTGAVALFTVDIEPHGISPEAEGRRRSPRRYWPRWRDRFWRSDPTRSRPPRPPSRPSPRGRGSPAR